MHPIVALAKKTVEEYVRRGSMPGLPGELDEVMGCESGVFVCLKKHGELRGCIGTIEPVTECAASECIRNAVAAATQDPRFPPIGEDELEEMEYTVDVLSPAEPVEGPGDLDPRRYGVIISKGFRRGLLLPDLEGVDTAEEQINIAALKAGIDPGEPGVTLERFEVRRYK